MYDVRRVVHVAKRRSVLNTSCQNSLENKKHMGQHYLESGRASCPLKKHSRRQWAAQGGSCVNSIDSQWLSHPFLRWCTIQQRQPRAPLHQHTRSVWAWSRQKLVPTLASVAPERPRGWGCMRMHAVSMRVNTVATSARVSVCIRSPAGPAMQITSML